MKSKQIHNTVLFVILMGVMFSLSPDVFAAGGLDSATSELNNIKEWGYKILGIAALGYIIFNVMMAYLGRKSWGDVAMAVVYAAIAGAALALGNWAWGIWGG